MSAFVSVTVDNADIAPTGLRRHNVLVNQRPAITHVTIRRAKIVPLVYAILTRRQSSSVLTNQLCSSYSLFSDCYVAD